MGLYNFVLDFWRKKLFCKFPSICWGLLQGIFNRLHGLGSRQMLGHIVSQSVMLMFVA